MAQGECWGLGMLGVVLSEKRGRGLGAIAGSLVLAGARVREHLHLCQPSHYQPALDPSRGA